MVEYSKSHFSSTYGREYNCIRKLKLGDNTKHSRKISGILRRPLFHNANYPPSGTLDIVIAHQPEIANQ